MQKKKISITNEMKKLSLSF